MTWPGWHTAESENIKVNKPSSVRVQNPVRVGWLAKRRRERARAGGLRNPGLTDSGERSKVLRTSARTGSELLTWNGQ